MQTLRPAPEGPSGRNCHPVDGAKVTPDSVRFGPPTPRGGLHPLSPVATRGTQRVLQPVYLASRFLTPGGVYHSAEILLRCVSTVVRVGPTVRSDGSVESVQDHRSKMAASTTVLIRSTHPRMPGVSRPRGTNGWITGKGRPTRSPSRSGLLQHSVKRDRQGILGPGGAGLKPLPG